MSFFEKLLEAGAPWWVVVGLIVLVVAAALLAALLVPDLLRPLVRREAALQPPNVIIHNHGLDNPRERSNRGRPCCVAGSWSRLAQELDMLKSAGDEVYIHDLPPEQA
jgi:hypothetical protein